MARKAKSTKPAACEVCAGTELVRRITTYAVRLTGPLEGKQIHVGRVALHECQTCEHLMPTPGRSGESGPQCRYGHPPIPRATELTRVDSDPDRALGCQSLNPSSIPPWHR
jgi:hypothetical protein